MIRKFCVGMLLFLILFTGCFKNKLTIKIVFVDWACAVASSYVVKAVIEEKFGYNTEMISVSADKMWQIIADGDADVMTTAWFPVTHKDYIKQYQGKFVDLGANFKGARIGLVVPSYVTINSLNELVKSKELFNSRIIGIDKDSGLMQITSLFIKNNNIDYKLTDGSSTVMTASLGKAITKHEWIVVTGWSPHWIFGKWNLKFLSDPDKLFGDEEEIHTIVRNNFKNDLPDVYRFLDNFYWVDVDISNLMMRNTEDGADPSITAKKWIKDNDALVKNWLK